MSKILEALDSEEKMKSLLSWLEGDTDRLAISGRQKGSLLSCGKRSRCRFRYGISFAILNAIRDACRPHLENATSNSIGNSGRSSNEHDVRGSATSTVDERFSRQHPPMRESYEEAFPSLTSLMKPASNSASSMANTSSKLATTDKRAKKIDNKRRIRPVQINEPVETASNFWIAQASVPASAATTIQNTRFTSSRDWGGRNGAATAASSALTLDESLKPVTKKLFDSTATEKAPVQSQDTPSSLTTVLNKASITPIVASSVATPSKSQDRPVKDLGNAASHRLENLVSVYITLFRSMLVPSTPLELHFLIRLLVLEEGPPAASGTAQVISFFQSSFATARDCRQFAVRALGELRNVLRRLPIQLVHSLVRCEPFRQHCGDLVKDLKGQLQVYQQQGLPLEYPTEVVTGTCAILSLPFDGERDSRHNYKTQAEIALYKNREESRDAFLLELRTFMGSKGKVFRPQDMERSQERVRQKARNIMHGLLSVNTLWFAQFYCDLLLQVGLAPVQETDQELLNITDQDKLQVSALARRAQENSIMANALFTQPRS
jgi:hypothetical protein